MDMTQPALSKTLARLREHFGDQLFVRVAFEMKPTTKALQLAPQIRSILKELSLLQCEQIPFVPETSTRNFNFAGPDAAVVLFLPPILKYIKEHAPDVRLSAVQLDMEHLHDWLESRTSRSDRGLVSASGPGHKASANLWLQLSKSC